MNLKQLRKEKGLKIKDLSSLTGIDRNQIAKIENNTNNAKLCNVYKIINALGFEMRLLLMNEYRPVEPTFYAKEFLHK